MSFCGLVCLFDLMFGLGGLRCRFRCWVALWFGFGLLVFVLVVGCVFAGFDCFSGSCICLVFLFAAVSGCGLFGDLDCFGFTGFYGS